MKGRSSFRSGSKRERPAGVRARAGEGEYIPEQPSERDPPVGAAGACPLQLAYEGALTEGPELGWYHG